MIDDVSYYVVLITWFLIVAVGWMLGLDIKEARDAILKELKHRDKEDGE